MGLEKLTKNVPLSSLETVILQDLIALIESGQKLGIRELATRNYTSTTTIIRLAKNWGIGALPTCTTGCSANWAMVATTPWRKKCPFWMGSARRCRASAANMNPSAGWPRRCTAKSG